MHKFLYWLISSNFLFHSHILGLKFFYTLSFQKCSIAFYLSLLVSKFLMRIFLIPLASSQHNLYDIYLMLCVQYWTPDDGQRNCLKYVEFYS